MARTSWFPSVRRRSVPAPRCARPQLKLEQLEDRVVPSTIKGLAFHDLNADGAKQSGEGGQSAWTLYLDANNNGTLDTGEASVTTDADGNYTFTDLAAATYTVREVVPAGWFQSKPGRPDFKYTVTLASDQTVDGRDFGNYRQGEIRGGAFEDANANGARETSETTQTGWTVYWDQNNNGLLDQSPTAFTSADVPKTLADLTKVTSTLAVSGVPGRTADVNVTLNITHTWDDDLSVFLISPAGTRVELFSRVGASGKNFTFTTLDDQAATPITSGTAPFSGSYRPTGSLAAVNGQDPNGTWTLEVNDDVSGDTGTLQGWSLTMTYGEPSTQTNASGAYAFTGLNPGTYHIREVLPPGWLQSKPAGTDLKYTVTLNSDQTVADRDFGNYRLAEIRGVAFEDLDGNGARNTGEPGVAGWMLYLDQNTNGTLEQSVANITATDVTKAIPDQGTATSRLTLRKLAGRILDVNLTLSITHTRDEDLSAFLVSPAGTRIELFTQVGGSGKDFTNTTLDDQAATAIASGTAPFTGSFRPKGLLAAVNGQDANGTWTLEIRDDKAQETGTLQSWSLAITLATEPMALSAANGSFAFSGLMPGSYTVREVPQKDWTQTRPNGPDFRYSVTLTSGQVLADRDFGNQRVNANPTTIEGINIDGNATNNGGFLAIPPDPNLAVGPNHILGTVNNSIQWFTKTGVREKNQSMREFFATLDPLTPTFDPKPIYDLYTGRFVVTVLERTDTSTGGSANTSRIFLAVSDDNDPNGTWYYHAIDAKITLSGVEYWADYPSLAVDADVIYLTYNLFSFGSGTPAGARLWIINKTPFYSGGTPTAALYDPRAAAGLNLVGPMYSVHLFGSKPANVGTFFVSAGITLTNGDDLLSILRVDTPLTNPVFSNQYINLGNITEFVRPPAAPQNGTSTGLETGDLRVQSAVWRNNTLWAVNTIVPVSGPDAGQATVHWYRIDTTNLAALALRDQGNVGGEDIAPGTHTFFPAITVNGAGTTAIGFSASAATLFPGAYYTGRVGTDAATTVRASRTLAAGQDFYVRTLGSGFNRWGDFSGIGVDPADDTTFWVYNEYALTRGTADSRGEDGRWGTRFGRFTITGDSGQAPPQQPDLGDDLADFPDASRLSVSLAVRLVHSPVGPEWLLALDGLPRLVLGSPTEQKPAAETPDQVLREEDAFAPLPLRWELPVNRWGATAPRYAAKHDPDRGAIDALFRSFADHGNREAWPEIDQGYQS